MSSRAWVAAAALGLLFGPVALAQPESCPLNFTATPNGPGSVTFHWSGFGGADAYQVYGQTGQGNIAGYSELLDGNGRDATSTNIASGDYTFWVVAYHSGTIVASSCHVDARIQGTQIPFFPSPLALALATVLGLVGTVLVLRRK